MESNYVFHRVFYAVLRFLIRPYFFIIGYRYRQYRPKHTPLLILTNHVTDWDFFLFGLAIRTHMYFVASEHILRIPFWGPVIRFLVSPVPRKKGADSGATTEEIKKRLRRGRSVCMMAEGNRSFSGETGFISPQTARLVKESGAALLTFAVHGGYMIQPRWADEKRRGPYSGRVVREYSPGEIAMMSEEELQKHIEEDLYVSAYADQQTLMASYRCKAPAESLETALFYCPRCGRFSTLKSAGDTLSCDCGLRLTIDDKGYFHSAGNEQPPFSTVTEWYREELRLLEERLKAPQDGDTPLFSDAPVVLKQIREGGAEPRLTNAVMRLFPDRLTFTSGDETLSFPLEGVQKLSIIQQCRLIFTACDGYYEVRSEKPYCALKYAAAERFLKGKVYR